MNMSHYEATVQVLEKKLQKLLKKYTDQQALLQQLQKENSNLQQQLLESKKMDMLLSSRLVENIQKTLDDSSPAVFIKTIDDYIRNLDACIAYFEKI